MEFQVAISPNALQDLRRIRSHIAKHSPLNAGRFIQALVDSAETLRTLPARGFEVEGSDGARFHVHKAYLVVYRIDEKRQKSASCVFCIRLGTYNAYAYDSSSQRAGFHALVVS